MSASLGLRDFVPQPGPAADPPAAGYRTAGRQWLVDFPPAAVPVAELTLNRPRGHHSHHYSGLWCIRSCAAAMNPLNSGCGAFGLLWNSGWNWDATKNG